MSRDASHELDELRRVFRDELDDQVTVLEREGASLSQKDAPEGAQRAAVAEIYRAAHSLKGAARAVDYPSVERLCHALEAHLASARRDAATIDAAAVAARADIAARALRRWADELALGRGPNDRMLLEAERQIDASVLGASPAVATPAVASAPASAPAPVAAPASASASASVSVTAPPQPPPQPKEPAAEEVGAPEPPHAHALAAQPSETVRVSVARLGELLSASEEVLSLTGRYGDAAERFAPLDQALAELQRDLHRLKQSVPLGAFGHASAAEQEARRLLDRSLTGVQAAMGWSLERAQGDAAAWRAVASGAADLAERARALRLVAFGSLAPVLERAAEEAARALGKEVRVSVSGAGVEFDRRVRDGLREPLLHLLRNAIDHGIESAAERSRAGKPAAGRLEIAASLGGRDLRITVRDDGRGIDAEAVRATALARGMPAAATAAPDELFAMLFEPGFTTRSTVTEISGRGVGLDVVRRRIAAMHGSVEIESEPHLGTTFTLRVPLDLSVVHGLIVALGEARFVLVTTAIARLLRVTPEDVHAMGGRLYLREPGGLTPLAELDGVLGLFRGATNALRGGGPRPCVVIAAGERRAAFLVDSLLDERDLVVRPLGGRVRRAAFVSGATVLSDGEVALVLDVADLVRLARPLPSPDAEAKAPARRRLLVADDSVTTRQLVRSILETAGYDVAVAHDGQDAWERLCEGEPFDLLVTDVEMPRMDGFQLLSRVRAAARTARLPVVLVTALSNDADRQRALDLGASAYIIKSSFDQEGLVDTIEQLL